MPELLQPRDPTLEPHAAFAVRRARQAQAKWIEVPIRERLAIVAHVRERVADRAPELARTVRLASRTLPETLSAEVMPLAV